MLFLSLSLAFSVAPSAFFSLSWPSPFHLPHKGQWLQNSQQISSCIHKVWSSWYPKIMTQLLSSEALKQNPQVSCWAWIKKPASQQVKVSWLSLGDVHSKYSYRTTKFSLIQKQMHTEMQYFCCRNRDGSGHVWMWELDHKEGWTLKNWCFWVVLKKTLESPLDCKEIKPVNYKGNQSWIFIGRTDAKAEAPILWPLDGKSQHVGKDFDAGKDWRQEEKGTTEDEMVGWHHQLNGHEFERALGDSEGQGILVCCSPWGHKELDVTEWWLNNKETWWACTVVLDSLQLHGL